MYYSGYSRRNTVCEILGMEIGKQAVNIFYVEFFPLLILKHFFLPNVFSTNFVCANAFTKGPNYRGLPSHTHTQILTPFLLRRLKMDVEFSLPPKKEVLVYAPLTAVQQKYYTSLLDRTILEMVGTWFAVFPPKGAGGHSTPLFTQHRIVV